MKVVARIFLVMAGTLMTALVLFPSIAMALPQGTCDSPGSLQGDFSLTPNSGSPDTEFTVRGSFAWPEGYSGEGGVTYGPIIEIYWIEDSLTTPESLGPVSSLYDDTTGMATTYDKKVWVPSSASAGVHQVGFIVANDPGAPACLEYTVVGSVQQDAYSPETALPLSLPDTGFALAAPFAGAGAALAGMLLLGRRRGRAA